MDVGSLHRHPLLEPARVHAALPSRGDPHTQAPWDLLAEEAFARQWRNGHGADGSRRANCRGSAC